MIRIAVTVCQQTAVPAFIQHQRRLGLIAMPRPQAAVALDVKHITLGRAFLASGNETGEPRPSGARGNIATAGTAIPGLLHSVLDLLVVRAPSVAIVLVVDETFGQRDCRDIWCVFVASQPG